MRKVEYLCETSFVKAGYVIGLIPALLLTLPAIIFKNVFLLFIPLIMVFFAVPMIKMIFGREMENNKRLKRLLKQGTKSEGKIVGYKEKSLLTAITGRTFDGMESMDSNIWVLVIENNGTTFETPLIVNNPNKIFKDTSCTVYEKDGVRIAYDFNCTDKDYVELKKIEDEVKNNGDE